MKPLTDKQKKIAWVVAAVLAIVHFGPRYVAGLLPTHAAVAKPSPVRPMPVRAAPVTPAAPSLAEAEEAQYLGVWAGQSLMEDRSTCRISLRVVKSTDDPTKVTGYETKVCMPTAALQGGRIAKESIPQLIRAASPVSSVLSGTPGKDGLTFSVDRVVGTQPGACPLTNFALVGFGPGQLQAQWQEGKCDSGQMLLIKRG